MAFLLSYLFPPKEADPVPEKEKKKDEEAVVFEGRPEHRPCTVSLWGKEGPIPIYQTNVNPISYDAKFLSEKITVEQVVGVEGAFILHNVMTPAECQQYIDLTERMGYADAPITTGIGSYMMAPGVRNNKRVIWQSSAEYLNPVWSRLQGFMPPEVKAHSEYTQRVKTWKPCGLNERLRFYRYTGGEQFRRHFDACYPRNDKEQSHLTLLIYLNEGFTGGETTFFPTFNYKKRGAAGEAGKEKISVVPKCGMALLFFHGTHELSPLHEGSVLEEGKKYVLRSDIMYRVEAAVPTPAAAAVAVAAPAVAVALAGAAEASECVDDAPALAGQKADPMMSYE